MTRSTLRRTLARVYWSLALVLAISFLAKNADHVPGLAGTGFEKVLKDAYEFLRDMSLLIATGGVAYITNVFQKRHTFVEALRQEWREIVQTKSALFALTQLERPSHDVYVATFCKVSETIDNMRTVYSNVGETRELIGLYPYAPLHDMRRVLQTLDPSKRAAVPEEERSLARNAILQSFYALRETFLEELDLEEPGHPLLIFGGKRTKKPGAAAVARGDQDAQRHRQDRLVSSDQEIDGLLGALYEKENSTAKPWRPLAERAPASPDAPARSAPLT